MTHLLLDVGYSELTDKQIAQFGGVSTRAFHKQFSGKQECLLAVVDAFVDETLDAMTAASADARDWPEAAYLGVKAGVTHLVIHPGLTRISLIDVFETGPTVGDYIGRSLRKLSNALAEGAPEPRRAPRIAHEAVAGALWAVVLNYAARRRLRYLQPLGGHLAFIVLAPYLGPKEAAQTIGRMSGGTAS
ncbi:MAG TPA: hypothetical protein VNV42_01025 [Solirubrobacteraceae bacterium]|jgi:AcrR family transcriptional regulator|nr:hypothetical protein [Solirubrobacteraceae bacterium]